VGVADLTGSVGGEAERGALSGASGRSAEAASEKVDLAGYGRRIAGEEGRVESTCCQITVVSHYFGLASYQHLVDGEDGHGVMRSRPEATVLYANGSERGGPGRLSALGP
jgi:hypothetical protein